MSTPSQELLNKRRGYTGRRPLPPDHTPRIDARATPAQPENNLGESTAFAQGREKWGWGKSPDSAFDEISKGWGWKPRDENQNAQAPANASEAAGAVNNAVGNVASAVHEAGHSQKEESVPQQVANGSQSPAGTDGAQAGGTQGAKNLAYEALQSHPFANGSRLSPSVTSDMVHFTPQGGIAVMTPTSSGPRSVPLTGLSLDQIMHARTNGQWGNWTPEQRRSYWMGGKMPEANAPQDATAAKSDGTQQTGGGSGFTLENTNPASGSGQAFPAPLTTSKADPVMGSQSSSGDASFSLNPAALNGIGRLGSAGDFGRVNLGKSGIGYFDAPAEENPATGGGAV